MSAFTHVTCAVCLLGGVLDWEAARAVGVLLAVFTTTAFHAAGALDLTCYQRMRRRHAWSPLYFYAGDAVLHVAPAAHGLLWRPPRRVEAWHMAAAAGLFLLWASVHSDRARLRRRGVRATPPPPPLTFDEAYVSLPASTWHACIALGATAAAAAGAHLAW